MSRCNFCHSLTTSGHTTNGETTKQESNSGRPFTDVIRTKESLILKLCLNVVLRSSSLYPSSISESPISRLIASWKKIQSIIAFPKFPCFPIQSRSRNLSKTRLIIANSSEATSKKAMCASQASKRSISGHRAWCLCWEATIVAKLLAS